MPLDTPARVARELARRGYNAEREAVTLLAGAPDPQQAIERTLADVPADAYTITQDHVRDASADGAGGPTTASSGGTPTGSGPADASPAGSVEGSADLTEVPASTASKSGDSPPETKGSGGTSSAVETVGSYEASDGTMATEGGPRTAETAGRSRPRGATGGGLTVRRDMTGDSTGTGTYGDFVAVFRDRYEQLSGMLRGRVTHRPMAAIDRMEGGADAACIGMVSDVRSTANGHRLVELEDPSGTFPCLVSQRSDAASAVDELLLDEVVAVQGRLADDAGILFVDALHVPDVPRTFQPTTADRHVQAALVSDLHVGSQEFLADAWDAFARWLHTDEAAAVEYLLVAGDMVEGVGVYPGQEDELDLVDVYEQYEAFAEHLKAVPGDLEVVLIPGNHDAVRLAEPQPGFDEELRDVLRAHDAHVASNPATVDLEGVSVLMYHGVSLDEVIAELPADLASYDEPHKAMYQLLRKRHVAPQFGERTRLAPEARDHLVIDEVPDVFHAGHVHKLGTGRYHNVTVVNSGCWQAQTAFQRRVNIDPDAGFAPILDLDTLDVTIRKFT